MEKNTFYLPLMLTERDVKWALKESFEIFFKDEPLTKDFWSDVLGARLSFIFSKGLSIKPQIGEWAFNVAVKKKYLIEQWEEGTYKRNIELLGRHKKDDD